MSELIRKLQNTDRCYCGSQLVDGEMKLVACLFHQAAAEIKSMTAEGSALKKAAQDYVEAESGGFLAPPSECSRAFCKALDTA